MAREAARSPAERWMRWLVAGLACALAAPLFERPGALPYGDGDPDHFQRLSFCRTVRDSVLGHGQYPLWTPYFGGGFPFVGSPDNPGVSPLALFCVAAPEALALRLWTLFCLLLGSLGAFATAREWLGLARGPALAAAWLYTACLWLPGRLLSGNYHELPLFALPFTALTLLRLLQRRWLGLLFPVLVSMGFDAKFGGLVVPLAVLVLALGTRAGFGAGRIAAAWGLGLACGVALALHRLLPALRLLQRDLVDQGAMTAGRGYPGVRALLGELVGSAGPDPNLWLGLGWLAALAAAAAGALAFRRALPLLVLALAAALFALGESSPLPVFGLLSGLPLLEAMKPGKYVNVVLAFALAQLAGLGLDALAARAAARGGRLSRAPLHPALALLCGALLVAQPLLAGRAVYGGIFVADDFRTPVEPFHQTASPELAAARTRYRYAPPRLLELNQYYNMRRNVGTITWYGGVILPEHAVPKYTVDARGERHPRTDYRGELYCARPDAGCRVSDLRLGYASLSFRAASRRDAVAVLNFNHDPRWRSDAGRVVERSGLLAVELPAAPEREVRLEFRDGLFAASLAAGALAALAWLIGGALWVRGRPPRPRDG